MKAGLRWLLGWGLGLAVLAWLIWGTGKSGWTTAWARWQDSWQSVPVWTWPVAALLWFLSFVLRARRMQEEWRWRRHIGLGMALRLVLVHNAAVLLLPMRSGELGYPWLTRQLFRASWSQSMRSLLWLRMQDAVVLGLLAWMIWPGIPVWLRGLGLLAGLVGVLAPPLWWRPLRPFLLSRKPWGHWTRLWVQRQRSRGGWWLSAGNWLLKLGVVGGLLWQTLAPWQALTLMQAVQGALGGELAALIPLQGPAGLGTYEAGVWIATGAVADRAALVATAALGVHAFCLMVSLVAALLWGALGPWSVMTDNRKPEERIG